MNNKNAYALNLIIIILELVGITMSLVCYGKFDLTYYTQDSNLLGLISAFIYIVYLKKDNIPKWVSILKYISVLCLTVTFLVVLLILGPMYNFNYLALFFEPTMFIYHLSVPIIAFISFVFYEIHDIHGIKDNLRAIYYTIIYGIITLILNILNVMHGPYPFLYVHENPIYMSVIYFTVIILGSFGIARLIERIKR